MGVESVSVVEVLSHADILEISCHSPTRTLQKTYKLSKDMKQKTYKLSKLFHESLHTKSLKYSLKLLGKTARTQIILSPETPWTFYIYLEYNTTYGANIDGTMGHKMKTRKHPRHGTQCIVQYPTNRNPAQFLQENAMTVIGPWWPKYLRDIYWQLVFPKYLRDIKSVRTEKFKFKLNKFLEHIFDEPKMSNYVTSSGSNNILYQLTHLRAQGIYQSERVPDSETEQS